MGFHDTEIWSPIFKSSVLMCCLVTRSEPLSWPICSKKLSQSLKPKNFDKISSVLLRVVSGPSVKEADQIMTKEGKVVVWSYWPERYYLPFMENVRKKLGIIIG